MKHPARLLGPAITVLLVLGGAAAATYDDDSAGDAAGAATSSTLQPDDAASGQTTSTSIAGSAASTTSTAVAGVTVATATPTTGPAEPTTAAPATAPPPRPADLIVHFAGDGPVTVTVENAGPGDAPEIVLVLSGIDDLQAAQLTAGAGVDCFGDGTVTCTIAASGRGGVLGEVEVPLPAGECLVAAVSSAVEDPQPDDNRRQLGDC